MEDKQIFGIVKISIIELEDKLMDTIEIANQYPEILIQLLVYSC